jgi:hypothetical protein
MEWLVVVALAALVIAIVVVAYEAGAHGRR